MKLMFTSSRIRAFALLYSIVPHIIVIFYQVEFIINESILKPELVLFFFGLVFLAV
jgi:hypothetical protein